MGAEPVAFSKYCFPLLKFSRETKFAYPYRDYPATNPYAAAAGGEAGR
jgi:hypothetical protein